MRVETAFNDMDHESQYNKPALKQQVEEKYISAVSSRVHKMVFKSILFKLHTLPPVSFNLIAH